VARAKTKIKLFLVQLIMRALIPSLAGLALLAFVWHVFSPTTEIHYEVKVAVNDGKHLYSRSGVWARKNTQYEILQSVIPGAAGNSFQAEAIPLEIPGMGLLLMLPLGVEGDSSVAKDLVFDAFDLRQPQHKFTEQLQMAASLPIGEKRRAPCNYDDLPKILAARSLERVRSREAAAGQNTGLRPQEYARQHLMLRGCFVFALLSDPKALDTFKVLPPGPGGRLGKTPLRVSWVDVAITDRPVTRRIGQYLPWLDNFPKETLIIHSITSDGSIQSTLMNGLPGEIASLR
jgi:hypothetical protein